MIEGKKKMADDVKVKMKEVKRQRLKVVKREKVDMLWQKNRRFDLVH